MKILHLNTFDISGGAARAAYRIHQGLQATGLDSKMLVQSKLSDDRTVIGSNSKIKKGFALLRPDFDSAFKYFFAGHSQSIFSPAWLPFSGIHSQIEFLAPDIVHLHWVCGGMLRIEELKQINKPLIWTLHDMWAFTGGCHYSDECERYKQDCGNCPQLGRSSMNDLSQRVLRRKKKAWDRLNFTIVTPSSWLAECAKESSLFKGQRIKVIHNGLDLNIFKPIKKSTARNIWNLPHNKKLILFGAMSATSDSRKGFDLLYETLRHLSAQYSDKAELIIFGAVEPQNLPDFGLPAHYLGRLHDDVSLALLYAAADIMVVPSRQDNLPNTVVESLACGTPVAAFDIGGMPDMIDHQTNGFLAKPFDTNDLAYGINCILSDDKRYEELYVKAREKGTVYFDIKKVAEQYAELYRELLASY